MTSLMSNSKNPFLKDYSQGTLLKRNYELLHANNRVLQSNKTYAQGCKQDKQSISTVSSTSNPYYKKSFNAFQLLHENKNPKNLHLSQVQSLSHSRNVAGSVDKCNFYKGLEDIGTKQQWKNKLQKEVRYQLKNYGSQTLRYEYHPVQKPYSNQPQIKSSQHSESLPQNFVVYHSTQKSNSKNQSQTNRPSLSFNREIISEYYGYQKAQGYQEAKLQKNQDDFTIQKSAHKPHKKRQSALGHLKHKDSRHSYIDQIPEDKNEDLKTIQNLNKLGSPQNPDFQRQSSSSLHEEVKRTSIEVNSHGYHPELSRSSGLGMSSQMYESGANFRAKFDYHKEGPLNMKAFDDDKSEEWHNDQSIPGSNHRIHPDTLQYNNKIYYQIPL